METVPVYHIILSICAKFVHSKSLQYNQKDTLQLVHTVYRKTLCAYKFCYILDCLAVSISYEVIKQRGSCYTKGRLGLRNSPVLVFFGSISTLLQAWWLKYRHQHLKYIGF